MIMSQTLDDVWLDFSIDSAMSTLVSPNDICPVAQPLYEYRPMEENDYQSVIYQQPQQEQEQQYQIPMQQLNPNQLQHEGSPGDQQKLVQIDQADLVNCQYESPSTSTTGSNNLEIVIKSEISNQNIGPPPILTRNEDLKVFTVQQQLDIQRALSHQRQEQLRARLEREPPRLPPKIMRKSSGKKMTGRERQQELERTETKLLQQRDNYLELINQFEEKCSKLREILGNIVTNSPEYNNQMLRYLEQDGLLIDSHID